MERQIESDVFSECSTRPSSLKISDQPLNAEHGVALRSEAASLNDRYLDFLANEIGRDLSLKGNSLVLDCANGAASYLAPALFERLGATVTTINNSPDGRNINLDCGSLHAEVLQSEVLKRNADLGVAFDGDADRALFVDSKGRLINGDVTLWILAKYLHARRELTHDVVVATVMSNIGLEIAFRSLDIKLVRTDVGDKYVLDELLRLGASLGGEQSGHVIFPKLSLAGDGMITTLSVLRTMKEEGKTLEELARGFQTFPQILVNVPVKTKLPFAEIASIQSAAAEIEQILGSRGRLLLRYSGTEPLARVMVEGESQQEIEAHARRLASLIEETLGRSA
jgi:phosphoglucosamine mutase